MQKRFLSKIMALVLSAALTAAIIPAGSAATSAAGENDLLSIKIADVTIKYKETAEILDEIQRLREADDQYEVELDWDIQNDCITRAAQLPVSFGTTDLANKDFNYEMDSDSYRSYNGMKTYEFVLKCEGGVSDFSKLVQANSDYMAMLLDEDVDNVGIGVVTVNGGKTRYICVRLTNLMYLTGRSTNVFSSDALRKMNDVNGTRRTNAYLSNLNLDLDQYKDYKMQQGDTVNVWLKACSKDKKSFVYVIPNINTTNSSVFKCGLTQADVKAQGVGTADIICSFDMSKMGAVSPTFTFTFTSGSASSGGTRGDVTGDDSADISDALKLAKYDAGLTSLTDKEISQGDVTGDKIANIADALKIARFDAGLIDSLE